MPTTHLLNYRFRYVLGVVRGTLSIKDNYVLAALVCHLWKVLEKGLEKCRIVIVKWTASRAGHSGDEYADELANGGKEDILNHLLYRRGHYTVDWGECNYQDVINKSQWTQIVYSYSWRNFAPSSNP